MGTSRNAAALVLMLCCKASGQMWTSTGPLATNWSAIAASADGTRLVATEGGIWPDYKGQIHTSTNSGTNWTVATAPLTNWESVACSADGSRVVAVTGYSLTAGGPIYISSDAGLTWQPSGAPIEHWRSVAASADGNKLVALSTGSQGAGGIFVSTNFGASWKSNSPPIEYNYHAWSSVTMSPDGNRIMTVDQATSKTYRSTDCGMSWHLLTNAPTLTWIASSASGQTLLGAWVIHRVHVSTNFGEFWWTPDLPQMTNWALACSAEGTRMVAAGDTSTFISTNSGITWTNSFAPFYWPRAICSSADGGRLLAVDSAFGGHIYVRATVPAPSLNIAVTSQLTGITWLVPSASFVLQQSSDLIDWTDTPGAAEFDPLTLHNKVTLLRSGANRFYRLKSSGN